MKRCLFDDYIKTFLMVRELLALDDDGGNLVALRQEIEYFLPDLRNACVLAFDDAMEGRRMRARVHFCRMHVGVQCAMCDGGHLISGGSTS